MGNAGVLSFREAVELRVAPNDLKVLVEGGILPVLELCEKWGTRSTRLAYALQSAFEECCASGLVEHLSALYEAEGDEPEKATEKSKSGIMSLLKSAGAVIKKIASGVKSWADGIAADWATFAEKNRLSEDDPKKSQELLATQAKANVDALVKKAGIDPEGVAFKAGRYMSAVITPIVTGAGKLVAKAAALAWKGWRAFLKDPATYAIMSTTMGFFGFTTVLLASAGVIPAAVIAAFAGLVTTNLARLRGESMKNASGVAEPGTAASAKASARAAGPKQDVGQMAAQYRYQQRAGYAR